jgi:hypothetical protein
MGMTGTLESNGVFQLDCPGTRFAQITDGLSQTLFLGEKHVPIRHFGEGWWDNSTFNGQYHTCYTRPAGVGYELATSLDDLGWKFGSYHTNLCQFAFGDGSARAVHNSIHGRTLGLLASMDDGEAVPDF